MFRFAAAVAIVAIALAASAARGDERAEIEFFETRIRPVLVRECYSCHSTKLDEPEGNLRLDSEAGARQGGDSGPAVVPGSIDESPPPTTTGRFSPPERWSLLKFSSQGGPAPPSIVSYSRDSKRPASPLRPRRIRGLSCGGFTTT